MPHHRKDMLRNPGGNSIGNDQREDKAREQQDPVLSAYTVTCFFSLVKPLLDPGKLFIRQLVGFFHGRFDLSQLG